MQTIEDLGVYTFPALLRNTVAKFGDRPALAFASGEPFSWAEFGERVASLRDRLWRLGVSAGDRVVIFSPSAPAWGVAYFAVVSLGAVAVPLLPDFSTKEACSCVTHSGAKAAIVHPRLREKIAGEADSALVTVLSAEDFALERGTETRSGSAPEVSVGEEDTASIIYTSGTTGRSKGVELSHKNLVFTAIGGQFFQRINKYDIGLSFLPMSHVYEFTIGFLMFLLNGASIYYLEKPPTVTTLLPALQRVRPTIILSVPIIMEKIYKNKVLPTFTSRPLTRALYAIAPFRVLLNRIAGRSLKRTFGGRVKFFGIGGAKVDPAVERFMKEARFPYAIGYGLTETSPLLAGSGPRITVPGTIGPAMPGVELRIDSPDPATGVGELVVRGPNVMKGYYRDAELTRATFTSDGWLRTGDLGSIDRKGRLSLKGRSKNMILGASGENIYPEDIEFVLNQHPFVAESLVVEGEGSSLVALVQLDEEKVAAEAERRGAAVSSVGERIGDAMNEAMIEMSRYVAYKSEEILDEIRFFVNENVGRISRIDRVELIERFEKTASQKIKRYLYTISGALGGHAQKKGADGK
jgi:long-chain acyl-CoA synthetase